MLLDRELGHRTSSDEVLLDDAFEHRRVARGVPGAVRIDDGNGPTFADPQAVGFGAQDTALVRETELLQASLQVVPCREPTLLIAAFRRALIAAQKDVAPRDRDADAGGTPLLGLETGTI